MFYKSSTGYSIDKVGPLLCLDESSDLITCKIITIINYMHIIHNIIYCSLTVWILQYGTCCTISITNSLRYERNLFLFAQFLLISLLLSCTTTSSFNLDSFHLWINQQFIIRSNNNFVWICSWERERERKKRAGINVDIGIEMEIAMTKSRAVEYTKVHSAACTGTPFSSKTSNANEWQK